MSAVPKRLLTPQEYLTQERAAEFRSEYYRGEVFAMSGASKEHCWAKDNLARAAGNELEDGLCSLSTRDLRVKVNATGLYTYPDIVIYCDQSQFEDADVDTLLNPLCVVEVLSDSTEKYDRGAKFEHYRQIPSLQEYLLVSQKKPLVERFVRNPDGDWLMTEFAGLDATFAFASVPVQVTLAAIYRRVEFPEPPLR